VGARSPFAPPSEAVGPQVVVGLASPRGEDAPSLELREARAASRATVVPHPELPAEPAAVAPARDSEPAVAAEAPPATPPAALESATEHASDRSLELAHATLASVRDAEPPRASEVVPPASSDEDDLPISAYPIALLNVTLAAHGATSSSAAPEAHDPLPEPPDESIPPMGDLSIEPHAARFFTDGEVAAKHAHGAFEEWDDHVDPAQHKRAPHVVERRARFARYVGWAVGVSAVVCLAALARTVMVPSVSVSSLASGTNGATVNALEAPAPRAAAAAAAPLAPVVVEAPRVDVPPAAAPPESEPVPAAAAQPTAEATPAASAEPATPTSDKTALEEKNDARRALERGKLTESIEAGERAVALDPQDGEAWLLLGAAYQEKGKLGDARRCYTACLKEGKRGPRGECQAMLR
jgi:hypothetical protein